MHDLQTLEPVGSTHRELHARICLTRSQNRNPAVWWIENSTKMDKRIVLDARHGISHCAIDAGQARCRRPTEYRG